MNMEEPDSEEHKLSREKKIKDVRMNLRCLKRVETTVHAGERKFSNVTIDQDTGSLSDRNIGVPAWLSKKKERIETKRSYNSAVKDILATFKLFAEAADDVSRHLDVENLMPGLRERLNTLLKDVYIIIEHYDFPSFNNEIPEGWLFRRAELRSKVVKQKFVKVDFNVFDILNVLCLNLFCLVQTCEVKTDAKEVTPEEEDDLPDDKTNYEEEILYDNSKKDDDLKIEGGSAPMSEEQVCVLLYLYCMSSLPLSPSSPSSLFYFCHHPHLVSSH